MLGELPQVWVEVDTTWPTSRSGSPGLPRRRRTRVDDHLVGQRQEPRHSTDQARLCRKPEGPWPLIADVENTGTFAWRLPAKLATSFFVRVQATDTAGNMTAAVSAEAVVMDLSQPTVEILSVESYRKR